MAATILLTESAEGMPASASWGGASLVAELGRLAGARSNGISSICCSYSTSMAMYTWSAITGADYGGWSSSSSKEMTISAFVEEPPVDKDDGPGVRGRRPHDPPEPVLEPPSAHWRRLYQIQ